MATDVTHEGGLVTNLGTEEYPERIVAIYYDGAGRPGAVSTEYEWDHSRKPWFRPGRGDTPTGWGHADYWFSYSRADDTLYWHQSGSGGGRLSSVGVGRMVEPDPPTLLFLAAGVRATIYEDEARPKVLVSDEQLLKLGYRRIHEPTELARLDGRPVYDPFAVAEEGETMYCSICRDYYYSEWTEVLCDHVHWDEEIGDWAGPGNPD